MSRAFVGDIEVTIYKWEHNLLWVKYPMFERLLPVHIALVEVKYYDA